MSETASALLLLRHGAISSHRGDVPLTAAGRSDAEAAGKAIAAAFDAPITVLFGATRRTRETAEAIVRGIGDPHRVRGPRDAFALRNPDIYVAGTRVDMVSSAEALAEQVDGLTGGQAALHPWFREFIASPDRIGWWLRQTEPPGDDADTVGRRILRFARSLDDAGPTRRRLVVGVTHSPILRSVQRASTGTDPGEPGYLTGARLTVRTGDAVRIEPYDPRA